MIWESISASAWASPLGWTLLHFLWQGAVIAAAVAVALAALARRSAGARYLACCAGLGLMIAAPAATFLLLLAQGPSAGLPAAALPAPDAAGHSALAEKLSAAVPHLPAAWLAGACLLLARTMLHWCNAQRLRRRGIGPAPAAWQRMLRELCEGLRIRRPVRLLESSLARVPMMIGWLRPVILVPVGAMTGLSPQQLRSILAHELAHVRRHDYLVNVVQAIVESLLFYHPGVWWLSDRLRVEREYCCDDVAVAVGGDALGYAQALSLLDALRQDVQPALASTGGTLMNRIRRVAGLPLVHSRRPVGWMAPLAVAGAVVLVVSSVGMSRPVERDRREPQGAAVERRSQPDVVAVLREMGAEEAEFIAVLRDAGLDDRELMIVLERIGLDEKVRRSFEHAARRHVDLDEDVRGIHERIVVELEAGRITEAEAEVRLHQSMMELHEKIRAGDLDVRRRVRHHGEIEEAVRARIAAEVAAGIITEEEAQRRLERTGAELRRHSGDHIAHLRHPLAAELIEAKMRAVREEIHREVEAGRMTMEEASERLDAVRLELRKEIKDQIRRIRRAPDADPDDADP